MLKSSVFKPAVLASVALHLLKCRLLDFILHAFIGLEPKTLSNQVNFQCI